ncbi:MAG: cell wall metabolism sensor histidine kinase WalK [Planctomycetes bacterium]|nr:cell wall metabolism sensor histidine kinase WalK [Planctomycetota bacterium]
MLWRLLLAFVIFAVLAAYGALFILPVWNGTIVPKIFFPLGIGAIALVPAFLLARRFVRPFQDLTEGANRIAEGDYGHRIHGGVWGESRSLARTFNTMSKRLEAQFHQLEADRHQLRTILGGMIEGVVALGPEQRVLFANEAAGSMLEFNPSTAVGRPIWEVTRLPRIQEVLSKALQETEARREELEWKGPTNRQLAIYVAALPGEPTPGAVLVLHDITELRRLERLRQDFVANVSHELKTPLSVIKACIEALIDGAVDDIEARKPFLDQISEQGERLHALILDLISLARIESGEEAMDFQDVAIEQAVTDCLDRHSPRAEAKNVQLVAVGPAKSIDLWADEEALEQILDNLVDNAVKYTPEGGTIRVSWCENGRQAEIQVEDTGPGIPERDLPRIFERFYRVDKARSRELGGTGLGLAIVKHLVQVMKGSVKASSSMGIGTSFVITLPQSRNE